MSDYINVTEAAALLGVNRRKIWQLVERRWLTPEENPFDRREKLFERQDVEKLRPYLRRKGDREEGDLSR